MLTTAFCASCVQTYGGNCPPHTYSEAEAVEFLFELPTTHILTDAEDTLEITWLLEHAPYEERTSELAQRFQAIGPCEENQSIRVRATVTVTWTGPQGRQILLEDGVFYGGLQIPDGFRVNTSPPPNTFLQLNTRLADNSLWSLSASNVDGAFVVDGVGWSRGDMSLVRASTADITIDQ